MFKYFKIASFVSVAVLAFGFTQAAAPPDTKIPNKGVALPLKKLTAEEIPHYLQDISVTIHANGSQGSGVIKTRNGVNYVLTAGHVIADLRRTRTVIDPKTGSPRVKIEFDDAKVVKEVYDDEGRSVGRLQMDAEVLRYSDADNGEDLALLRLRKKNFVNCSVRFDKRVLVPVGTDLLHVGSLLGQQGSNSLTTGVVSQNGRVLRGVVYDQSTCAAFPGSSGGGIYRKSDGTYVGMLVRGAGETFNLYVPLRRMHKWADRVGIQFVLDDAVEVPTDKVLQKTPVEEVGGEGAREASKPSKPHHSLRDFPFLIKKQDVEKRGGKITLEW